MTADLAPPIDDAHRVSIWEQLREVVDPTGYRPKQRDGLVWSRLTTVHGEEYVIIQNPERRNVPAVVSRGLLRFRADGR